MSALHLGLHDDIAQYSLNEEVFQEIRNNPNLNCSDWEPQAQRTELPQCNKPRTRADLTGQMPARIHYKNNGELGAQMRTQY